MRGGAKSHDTRETASVMWLASSCTPAWMNAGVLIHAATFNYPARQQLNIEQQCVLLNLCLRTSSYSVHSQGIKHDQELREMHTEISSKTLEGRCCFGFLVMGGTLILKLISHIFEVHKRPAGCWLASPPSESQGFGCTVLVDRMISVGCYNHLAWAAYHLGHI